MEEQKKTEDTKSKHDNRNTTMKYAQSTYLKHRCNAACEYKLGSNIERFEAYERKKIDKKILEDNNYKKVQKYFTVEKGE